MKNRYRAIFISDLHLGLKASQAEALLDFLRRNQSPVIYLVGDIIDFWALKRNPHWPPIYNKLIHYLFSLAEKGIKVVYLPGNHDEFLELCYGKYGNFSVVDRIVHTTAKRKKLLVLHGHQFDYVSTNMNWLEKIGDLSYDVALSVSAWISKIRKKFGLPYWSFSAWAKHQVKGTVTFIEGYQRALEQAAREQKCDGVVAGHIHTPSIDYKDDFIYCNTGDWVESLSALVETEDGGLKLIRWVHAAR